MSTKTPAADTPNFETTEASTRPLPAAEGGGGSSTLAELGQSLVEEMPAPQEHAISESQAGPMPGAAANAGTQIAGETFDPAIHDVDADGNPIINSRGKLKRKRGRKPGNAGESAAPRSRINSGDPASRVQIGPTADQLQLMQARQAGNAAAHLLMTFGVIAGGDEWQPRIDARTGLDEKAMLEGAFGDYFVAKAITDIPPGMALCVAIGGYMLPRFAMPKTQTRLGRAKQWIAKKLADRKLKKHGLKAEERKSDSAKMAA